MKRTTKLFKLVSMTLILLLLGMSLISCGGAAAPEDANGTAGALTWKYEKNEKRLTILGPGEMPNFENSAAVSWAQVAAGVETLVVGDGITNVGNYAFYGMSALKEVSLPATLTSIGSSAFAFAAKLESVQIPTGVTAVGAGAFEGCGALTLIKLPETVNSVGDRAFAFCYSLSSALITSKDVTVGPWAFKNCGALSHLVFSDKMTAEKIAADAFEGASKNFDNAVKTDNPTGATTVTVHYVEGDSIGTSQSTYEYGESYSIPTPAMEGYTPDIQTVTGIADGAPRTVTVTYTKNAPVEEAPAETEPPEEEKTSSVSAIIAVVIMAVVLIGIAVGAFLLMRPEKNAKKGGKTASKNGKKAKK